MNQIQYPNALMWMLPFVPHQSGMLMSSLAPVPPYTPVSDTPLTTEDPIVVEELPVVEEPVLSHDNIVENGIKSDNKISIDISRIYSILVDMDYECSADDMYVGVNSSGPTKITLPSQPTDGKVIIVKAEMKSPLTNRKVTVLTSDGSLIDGSPKHLVTKAYSVLRLLYRGGNWHVF